MSVYKEHSEKHPLLRGVWRSSNSFVAYDSVVVTTGLTKSEAFRDKEVFEVLDFGNTAEGVLLTEGVLSDEELVREASQAPGGLTVGEYTSLK